MRNEHADELSGSGVVFADADDSIWSAERVLARDHDVPVGGEGQIKRTQFRIGDQAIPALSCIMIEYDDRVIAFSGRQTRGRGRYSLFTGDIGAALLLASCLRDDAGFPFLADL